MFWIFLSMYLPNNVETGRMWYKVKFWEMQLIYIQTINS